MPIRNMMRRGRHTASSSWGFNQPLPPDFLDEPLPTPPDDIRELIKNGYQTASTSFGARDPVPPDTIHEPPPAHARRKAEHDVEGAEADRPTTTKVAGISRFNTFRDADDIARAERSRRMRKKMERAGWPMTGERRTWI